MAAVAPFLPISLLVSPLLNLPARSPLLCLISLLFSSARSPCRFSSARSPPAGSACARLLPSSASISSRSTFRRADLLKLGLVGAAASLNISWWVVVLRQFAYILRGYCPGAWNGFSWGAFRDLGAFARLSIASTIMLCLEFWYYMLLLVLAGRLRNAEVAVAAISICTNLSGWEFMIFIGFNAAISVRISYELGAGRPRAAKLSVPVVVASSAPLGLVCFGLVLALRDVYATPFTNSPEVTRVVSDLAVIFAFTLLLNSVQPVLTGVAVGAGWQWLVAYVNIGCYYIVGLPLGFFLGSKLDMSVMGVWSGDGVWSYNADPYTHWHHSGYKLEERGYGSRIEN
ncbi:hypothetical protein ACLOJK_017852 [Asimina triloba]